MRKKLYIFGYMFVLLALLSACEIAEPVDQPAAELDVSVSVADLSADGTALVTASFEFNGTPISLTSDVTVECNGVALQNAFGIYTARVPTESVGGVYTITHKKGDTTAEIKITVPSRPEITSPKEGDTLKVAEKVTITYTSGNGKFIRATASNNNTSLSGNDQSDTGEFKDFDVSALAPGKGTVGIVRGMDVDPAQNGFKSVKVSYESGASVNVTWE
ncbi:MAG: hypothetical protein CL920_33025 [Deltaproteobacteria bacterium]|nr:hypothetical protein [Deltaproteobacteria bacterium]MBU53546.1 hypothetical protein [Deltaproteobacteria bacterium]|tara:strand:- start:3492 stop:4145 length:654 start_codon:yes stop_codon:yes gene_type:complete